MYMRDESELFRLLGFFELHPNASEQKIFAWLSERNNGTVDVLLNLSWAIIRITPIAI